MLSEDQIKASKVMGNILWLLSYTNRGKDMTLEEAVKFISSSIYHGSYLLVGSSDVATSAIMFRDIKKIAHEDKNKDISEATKYRELEDGILQLSGVVSPSGISEDQKNNIVKEVKSLANNFLVTTNSGEEILTPEELGDYLLESTNNSDNKE